MFIREVIMSKGWYKEWLMENDQKRGFKLQKNFVQEMYSANFEKVPSFW